MAYTLTSSNKAAVGSVYLTINGQTTHEETNGYGDTVTLYGQSDSYFAHAHGFNEFLLGR